MSPDSVLNLLKNFFLFSKELWKVHKWVPVLLLAIPAAAVLVNGMYGESLKLDQLSNRLPGLLNNWETGPVYTFDMGRGLVKNENNGSTIRPEINLVEFADYRCPHCKHAFPAVDAFVEAHSDVQFVFKVFALDGTCNPSPDFKDHGDGSSCALAKGAYCANKLGGSKIGWAAHHYTFEHQEDLRAETKMDGFLEKMGSQLGLADPKAFQECIKSSEAHDAVAKQSAEGVTSQVMGTPSFYLNGKHLELAQFLPVLEAAYKIAKTQK